MNSVFEAGISGSAAVLIPLRVSGPFFRCPYGSLQHNCINPHRSPTDCSPIVPTDEETQMKLRHSQHCPPLEAAGGEAGEE